MNEIREIIGNTTATPNPRPDWAQTDETKADFIKNKPVILTEDEVKTLIDNNQEVQIQSNWNQNDETQLDYIKNKPIIPSAISQLTDDETHRTVSDVEKENWNSKSTFSGLYEDLIDKPNINIGNGEGLGSIKSSNLNDDDRPYTEDELPVASGHEAIAFGKNVEASGKRAVAIGNGNISAGNCSVVIGQANEGTGSASLTGGNQNKNKGNYTLIMGQENSAEVGAHSSLIVGFRNHFKNVNPGQSQLGCALIGHRLESSYSNVSIFGSCNKDIAPITKEDGTYINARFVIGNGYSDGNADYRSNALEVYDDGRAKLYGVPKDDNDIIRLNELKPLLKLIDGLTDAQIIALNAFAKSLTAEEV